jgi:hypothetical protein
MSTVGFVDCAVANATLVTKVEIIVEIGKIVRA